MIGILKAQRVALAAVGVMALLSIPSAVPAQARAGDLRRETKPIDIPGAGRVQAELCSLTVPENRSDPKSRLIELTFMRLPGKAGASGPPLVYLAGGPGDAAVTDNPQALAEWAPLLELGDVILLDQRGTGRSTPNLAYRWTGQPPVNLFRSFEDGLAYLREFGQAAAAHFRAQGVDFRGYTTVESADDLEAIRAALGADKLNLLGFSYGTHLGLAAIRRHGERLANVVLIGVEGPAHTLKLPSTMDVQFRKIALMAGADPAIAAKVPDLNALLLRILSKLDRAPMVVTIRDQRNGGALEIPVGSDGLRFILRRDIGDASDLPVFPRLLYSIDRGDPTLLTWFVQKRFAVGVQVMSSVMDAASGVSPERMAMIEAEAARSPFKNVSNWPSPEDGDAFGAPDLGATFRSPIVSNVRTLFLAGTLDWNTPPFQAEEVRWGFPNSSLIVVKNAGHEQILGHPAIQQAIVRFLRGERVDDVTAAYPPLRFVPLEGYDPAVTHPSVAKP